MDLEPRSFLRRVIGGTAERNNGIEGVFPAARPALPSIDASMVNEKDSNSFPPQPQKPILHWQPSITRTLATARQERGEVVQYQKVNAVQMTLKGLLALIAAEIDARLGVISGKDAEPAIRNFSAYASLYQGEPQLKFGQRHLAVNVKDVTRSRRCPAHERTATRNSQANGETKPTFAGATGRVKH
jgi:hypothetical protein